MKKTTPTKPDQIRPQDTITILGNGKPRDFINNPLYLTPRRRLWNDRWTIISAILAAILIVVIVSICCDAKRFEKIQALQSEIMSEIPTDAPTIAPTVFPTITPEITPTTVTIQLAPIIDRRIFKITAYCSCAICCKKTDGITYSGAHVQEGLTCAADLSVLPLGTAVDIEGVGLRTVQDKGSKVRGDHLDVYTKNHADALAFGIQYRMVTIFEKEDEKMANKTICDSCGEEIQHGNYIVK